MNIWKDFEVTEEYLKSNPNSIFVFGDNCLRIGTGGAAKLRHLKNTYGMISKKTPSHNNSAYYKAEEYKSVYEYEINKLKGIIKQLPNKTFLITRIGGGIANKYKIWEKVILPNIVKDLEEFENVVFLFDPVTGE